MIMSGRISKRTIAFAAAVLISAVCSVGAGAQAYGSYTPYSFFGVGDLFSQGTAYNKSMGGVGIATRSTRFINPVNPAAVTARDSLAFMADFSLYGENKIFRQGDMKSASNTCNIGDLIISFPIWKSSAMMVGLMPYSSTGYGYKYSVNDDSIIGKTGDIVYAATGQGALYQAFAAAGVTFFDRISLGAQVNYIFGQTDKKFYETFANASYNGANNGFNLQLNGVSGKFGIQYEQPLGSKSKLTVGATYAMDTPLNGFVEGYKYSAGSAASDTLYYKLDTLSAASGKVRLASEIGVGINFKYGDQFMAEFDYSRSDWTTSGMSVTQGFMGNMNPSSTHSAFSTNVSETYRFGMEYVPNRNDIRYFWKKCAYRAGAYYKNEYYLLDGHDVTSVGITLGTTLPIFRWSNGLTLGIDFGQRGSMTDNMIRERYFNFSVGVNIFDIWFQKPRYD